MSAPSLPVVVESGGGSGTLKGKKDKKDKKGKKARLTKEDIGTPTDFRHVGHIGWDPEKGFDVSTAVKIRNKKKRTET